MHPTLALSRKLRELSPQEGREIYEKLEVLALDNGLWSEVKGAPVPLKIAATPWFVTARQTQYLAEVAWAVRQSLKRLTRLWFQSQEARALLPLAPLEEQFFNLFGDPTGLPEERLSTPRCASFAMRLTMALRSALLVACLGLRAH